MEQLQAVLLAADPSRDLAFRAKRRAPDGRSVAQRFEVLFEPEEGGGYHVYWPAVKGCHSFGRTSEAARGNIAEAIELWLESAAELHVPVPEREIVEVRS